MIILRLVVVSDTLLRAQETIDFFVRDSCVPDSSVSRCIARLRYVVGIRSFSAGDCILPRGCAGTNCIHETRCTCAEVFAHLGVQSRKCKCVRIAHPVFYYDYSLCPLVLGSVYSVTRTAALHLLLNKNEDGVVKMESKVTIWATISPIFGTCPRVQAV